MLLFNAVGILAILGLIFPYKTTTLRFCEVVILKDFDTVLVGFDHSHGDPAVLIVGRKAPRDNVQIINQFQGKEAEELYQKLVGEEKTSA